MPLSVTAEKSALRRKAREQRREAFLRFRERIGPILAANFLAAFSLGPHEAVAGYWPMGEEADLRPLLLALARRGHDIGLPRVVRPGAPLEFLRWRPGDVPEPGFHGVPEPDPGNEAVDPAWVLVPLLAFDGTGMRLGYGGGYYDRTLAAMRARGRVTAVGVAFSAQEVDRVPGSAHDARLDWIMTEAGCRRLGEERSEA